MIVEKDLQTCFATHPITFTAYNGTPTLDGVDQSIAYGIDIRYGPVYINISGITIKSYDKGIYIRESNNVHISNCEIYDTYSTAVHFLDVTNSSLSDSDIHDIGWNGVMVQTNFHPTHHISIINNTFRERILKILRYLILEKTILFHKKNYSMQ